MTRSQQTNDYAFVNTVNNTDSSSKTTTMKETGKVTDINMINVDTTEDNNIKDNKEATNIDNTTQTKVESDDRPSTPQNDNEKNIVNKFLDNSNNITDVVALKRNYRI